VRVTDRLRFETFKTTLGRIKGDLDVVQEQMASQKKILHPSDDAVGFSKAMELEAEQERIARYKTNLEGLETLGAMYDSSVMNIQDLLTRVKEITVSQSSDTASADTRKTSAEEVTGIIEQLVTLGNTKVGNTYIFGGKKSDTAPFVLDDADYSVTFQGSTEVTSVFVDKGEYEKAGISGSDIFYGGSFGIFEVLKDLKDALETNDADSIRDALTTVETALDLTENNIAYVGAYTSKIENFIEIQDAKQLRYSETISDLMDADMVELVSDFNTLSNAYQYSLYSMSKLQALSILNYLS
jgi:flagellar hook-associated protein 3 FlgL